MNIIRQAEREPLAGDFLHSGAGAERRRAFTLIELLIVVAIIAILAAMLLPALNRTKMVAKQVQCMNNLRNWTLASLMYAGENAGWLPARELAAPALYAPNVVGAAFRGQIEPYGLKETSNFCPEGAVRPQDQSQCYPMYGGSMGYMYYAYLVGSAGPRTPQKINDTQDQNGRPSLLFADINRMWSPTDPLHTNHRNPSKPVTVIPTEFLWLQLYCGIPRGLNNAYLDGHVEWIRFEQLDQAVYFQSIYGDYSYHWPK